MKICVIGSGSTYTPELMDGFIKKKKELPVKLVTMFDIDENRLNIVGSFARRMIQKSAPEIKIELTTNRKRAIEGAKFVLTQIRVGGQSARQKDTLLGLRNGVIGQETVGVGGFAKALRTIPVILDICRDIRKYSPQAWLINFTNPSGIITETVLKYGDGVKVIGLCNGPIGLQMNISRILKVPYEKIYLDYIGLNHFSFVRKVLVGNKDYTDKVLNHFRQIKPPKNIKEAVYDPRFIQALHKIPSGYLMYYYLKDQMLHKMLHEKETRAQVVARIEKELLKMYKDETLNEKPKQLEQRGGAYYSTAAVNLVNAIYNDKKEVHIVNCRNNDTIKELPSECAIEVPAKIGRNGAQPVKLKKLEPEIRGMINLVKSYEELTVEAGARKSYRYALLALANNPLVTSVNLARVLLDKLLKINNLKYK